MAHAKGIIAYGTDEDRRKLAELAKAEGVSGSQWLLRQIRKVYEKSKEQVQ
jgi:hypothetical protein